MATKRLGIIVNGATGGIARRQHLPHALLPILRQGGLQMGEDIVELDLMLVARNATKLASIAGKFGIGRWTTDLTAALSDDRYTVLFDAGHTGGRVDAARAAIAAGKHVYTEKPVVTDLADGRMLLASARAAGIKFGVVEDKLSLPGMAKLYELMRSGFFGTVTNFRANFGFWFFDGYDRPDQRGSWNYKASEGGGLTMDMFPHWRYLIEGILGPIKSVCARSWTAVLDRLDESGQPYVADADDSSVAIVELASGAIGTISTSVATRVRGDDLLSIAIDGTAGSAIAGLHRCHVQPAAATPSPIFDPATDHGADYRDHWQRMADTPIENGYRKGWEAFIRHVASDAPLEADLTAGLRDIALAKAVLLSSAERRWVSLDELLAEEMQASLPRSGQSQR